jgi:hypothetical protein
MEHRSVKRRTGMRSAASVKTGLSALNQSKGLWTHSPISDNLILELLVCFCNKMYFIIYISELI